MNKKADYTVAGFLSYVLGIIFMIIAIFVTLYLVNMVSSTQVETQAIEAELVYNKLVYTGEGIMYVDETGQNHPHIIDMARFNNVVVDGILNYPYEKYVAAMLTLKDKEGDTERVVYYNQEWYHNWVPMAKAGILGKGSITEYVKRTGIHYKENDEVKPGFLEVSILVPNSR